MQPTIVRLLGLGLILDLVLVLPTVLAQSACSFAQDGTTPTGNDVCNCFESQNPMGWIVDCSKKFLAGVPTGLPAETVYLSLNENSITALSPISLEGLSSLEILQIQNNGLRSDLIEDGAFANLPNLKSLDLSNNRIALSSAMIRHLLPLTRLQTLTLTNNNINTIDSSAVEIFDRLDTLDLTSNVFVCDCDLSWFRNWLLNTGHVGHQITGATCSSPLEYQREEITGAGFCPPSVCILCNGGSDAECNSQPSAIQTCSSSQGACFNEIRVTNGVYSIQKSCKQIQACLNQVRSNARQCNAGTSDSVCRTCCLGDLCNRPASGVLDDYTLPGFPRDPSLVVETTTPLKTTVTEATTVSATTESTNKYTTVNDTVDMITTSSATLETTTATTSAKTISETTASETTTLPVATTKNSQTIETTLTSRETSVSEIQTLSGKTTMVLQTTPFPRTPISNTLTPLVTRVSPTTGDAVKTTLEQTQTPTISTTPVLQTTPSSTTPISNTLTPLVTRVSPTTEDSVKTTLGQTQTPSISTTPVLQSTSSPRTPISNTFTPLVTRVSPTTGDSVKTTSEQTQTPSISSTPVPTIRTMHVSTSQTTIFSTLLSTTQEETTDSTTRYTSGLSDMSTSIPSTYPATETTPTPTTSSSSSPPSTSPSLISSLAPDVTSTTSATSPISTFESVEMTSGSVTTPISTQTVSSKEATTVLKMQSSTSDLTQMSTDTNTITSTTATAATSPMSTFESVEMTSESVTTPISTQTVSSKEAITIPTMQSPTPISTQTVSSKGATTISTMQSSTSDLTQMSTDTNTFTSTTRVPSQSTTSVRTTPLPLEISSSTSSLTTFPSTTPVMDTSLPTSSFSIFESGTTMHNTQPQTTSSKNTIASSTSSTRESDTLQSTFQITTSPLPDTTPATSSSPISHETLDITLTTISETVQTSRNTPASPLSTQGTTASGPDTTETFTQFTSTLNTPPLTLATTQTSIPTTLPHVQSTTAPSSTSDTGQTTLGKTSTTLYSDLTSISYTTRMSSATPSTDAPISSSAVSTVSVIPTTDPSNTTPTFITGASSSKPERKTFQYTTPMSTPTYSSTLMNTDPPETTSGSGTTSVPSTAPSTKPSTTLMGVSSTSTSTLKLSSSSEPTTLSSTPVATVGSSSSGFTKVSPISSTSTAQTSSSPSGMTSPESSSYSSTQKPGESTTESMATMTTTGRPLTTAASTPHCPEDITSGEFGAITWLRTPGTETAEVECPYGSNNQQSATATRFCRMKRADVTWDDPNTSSCATSSQVLQRLSEVPIISDNAQTVSKNLTTVTSSPTELNETDVDLAVDVLENLARSITEYNSAAVVENAVDAINNLAGAMMETLAAGQRDAEIATRVLHLIDEFALHVDFEGDMFEAVSERIDVVVVKINTEMINGLSFRSVVDETGTSKPQLSFNNTNTESTAEASASLELPGSLFETHRGEIDRVQFVIYKDVIFFEVITEATQNGTAPTPPTISTGDDVIERDALNSLVISASLGDLKILGLRDPVKTSFIHQRPERADNPSCVFWDFAAADGKGTWSTEGCIASVTAEGSTQCECDHLTNFALLMDIYGTTTTFNGDHMMALSIITFAGCTLSILGLVVTFFSYIMIRQLRSDRRTRVLLNLVVALTFMNVCFLTDAVLTEFGHPGEVACKLLGALLHYGLLTSIAWMALEAWHMYLALVKVFDSYTSHLMKKMCVIGWGLPAVIVGILLGVDLDHYDFYNEFCWLKVGGIPFYASFVAPSLAVILFNFIIFSLVTNQLCSLRRRSVAASSEQFDVSAQLRASLSITVLLGLTWGLGIFMIGEASLVFSYLFAIFNSFQGFSIFVFHCLLKEEVRLGWRKVFCPQCLTLEEMTKSSSGQNFSSSNKQAQLQKRMTLEYQVTTVESNGRHHQSQSTPFHPEHEVPRFNPFATNSEFYQDSRI